MSDPRFARLKTDPRFRRPKKTQNKVVVDERFKSVLQQEKKKDKSSQGRVDKYGRALSSTHDEDNLKRFYRLKEDEQGEEVAPRPDYARGAVLMESSDEEDEHEAARHEDSESDAGGVVTFGYDPDNPNQEDPLAEIDLDEENFADLDAQAAAYSKNNPENDYESEAPRTRRLAVVNLDWDHVRAAHLYKIFSSLVSPTAPLVSSTAKRKQDTVPERALKEASQVNVVRGKVLSVMVYPSAFGKERIAREEKEGPPAEIFKRRKDTDEITARSLYEVGGEDEVDEDALRRYQLERLRYYYAVVTCDSVEAASHIYDELQGTELERSANVFDLSFVPDDMSFENEPRDEATEDVVTSAKGIDFVTDALRHSKVKLTWDEDDPERNQVTRRTLTKEEIDKGDFRAYIASSSESESEGEATGSENKKAARDRLRALLLGGNPDAMPEGWGEDDAAADIDMEITFTPGLTEKKEDETTLDKYQRKIKEKKKKRKEELREKFAGSAKPKGKRKEEPADDFFEAGDEAASDDDVAKRKGNRRDREDEVKTTKRSEAMAEELALLLASDNPITEPRHFDYKAVIKTEKQRTKKGQKKDKNDRGKGDDELQEDFVMDVQDERFKVLHEDHQFAIDPSNPHFKKTKGMAALLEERRKRLQARQYGSRDDDATGKVAGNAEGKQSLEKLVESVKRKSADSSLQNVGKRRKL